MTRKWKKAVKGKWWLSWEDWKSVCKMVWVLLSLIRVFHRKSILVESFPLSWRHKKAPTGNASTLLVASNELCSHWYTLAATKSNHQQVIIKKRSGWVKWKYFRENIMEKLPKRFSMRDYWFSFSYGEHFYWQI